MITKTKRNTRDEDYLIYNLNSFFIVDPPNDLHTNFSCFWEIWLVDANVPQDFNHSFPYTNTSVLQCKKEDEPM